MKDRKLSLEEMNNYINNIHEVITDSGLAIGNSLKSILKRYDNLK